MMKMKYIVPMFALMGTLAACDDYDDQFDFLKDNGITDEKNLTVALSGSDYATIADLEANKSLAEMKQDQAGGNYVEALAALKENKYFTVDVPAADYIPAWLEKRYPEATNGSRIKVSYNEYRGLPDYLSGLKDIDTYTLTEKDYKAVWGNGKSVLYLTPQSLAKVDGVLKEAYPNAADGTKVVVNYAYDDLEPSIGGGDEKIVAYVPVKEVAEEGGRYVIAAMYTDGKYYPFGNTDSWSKTFGDFTPQSPLALTDGRLPAESGATDELTLEKGVNGYLVKNAAGYYLYMAKTYTNFNRTQSVPTEGAEWIFTSNADGTVAMVNVEKEKTVKLTVKNDAPFYNAYPKEIYEGKTYFEDECSTLATTKFTMKDVQLPEGSTYVWKVDEANKYWKASAYVGGGNKVSESYIVSSQIDLTDASAPILMWAEVLNHVKTGQTVDDLAVWVSEDFADNVEAATWTKLESEGRASGKNWNKAYPEADLSAYKGKKVHIAYKYVSTTASASTWEVWDVVVKDRSNYWDVCLLKGMTQSEIDESASAASYTMKAVRAGEVQATHAVVYTYNGEDKVWKEYKADGAIVTVIDPATYASIGADYLMRPETQIPVFLAKNYPYAANGYVVGVVYINSDGKVTADEYKFASGVWKLQTAVVTKKLNFILGEGKWVAGANSYFENTLLGDKGGFTTCDVVLGELNYVWTNTSNYGWKGSAFANNKQNPAESWLVSPAIFLEESEVPVLTFDEAANKMGDGKVDAMFTVWVTKDVDKYNEETPDISACNWVKLTLDTRAAGESWDFVNVGQVDLSEYNGETVRIAFKYTSTDTGAGTWEIKNFSIAERSE